MYNSNPHRERQMHYPGEKKKKTAKSIAKTLFKVGYQIEVGSVLFVKKTVSVSRVIKVMIQMGVAETLPLRSLSLECVQAKMSNLSFWAVFQPFWASIGLGFGWVISRGSRSSDLR